MKGTSHHFLVLICVALRTEQTFEYEVKESMIHDATDNSSNSGSRTSIESENSIRDQSLNEKGSTCPNAVGGLPTLFDLTLRAHGCEFRVRARALGSAATVSGGCALRVALSVSEGADRLAPPSLIHAAFAGGSPHACCGGYVKGYFAHAGYGGALRMAVDLMTPRTDIATPRDLAKHTPADCNHRSQARPRRLITAPCPPTAQRALLLAPSRHLRNAAGAGREE
jgi:hypothetical protein